MIAPPAVTVCVAGAVAMPKSVTASVTVVLWIRLPHAPCTVRVSFPAGVVFVVVTVRVEEPSIVMDVGLNTAVAPVGNPLALSATVPSKPLMFPMFTV